MTIKELITLIEQWAIDRGLDKNGTVEGQLIKTSEEVSELIIGISKDDIDVIKDSIGDVFVTLVVGNLICNSTEILKDYQSVVIRDESKYGKYNLIMGILYSMNRLMFKELYAKREVSSLMQDLMYVCKLYDLDFLDCVESAYNEIADRKGVVKNGTFIKEEDLV
nr:MAG TPA: NTP-PPase-like protein [Caudoviricetes sp.]